MKYSVRTLKIKFLRDWHEWHFANVGKFMSMLQWLLDSLTQNLVGFQAPYLTQLLQTSSKPWVTEAASFQNFNYSKGLLLKTQSFGKNAIS